MLHRKLVAFVHLSLALHGLARPDHQPVTGPPVGPTSKGVPLRRNINEFAAAGGPQWDLYLLALRALQQENDEDPLSFFQIMEWNGAGAQVDGDWQGYCPHFENIFLPWHRPFTSLFEQVLVSKAKEIALTYPENVRAEYSHAADTLRSPYWDWAADSRVPPATVPFKVRVNHSGGADGIGEIELDNPLRVYRFPKDVLQGKYGKFDPYNRPEIYRCNKGGYPAEANRRMTRFPFGQWVYDVFTSARSFDDFCRGQGGIISLEQLHDSVHFDSACREQMLEAELAAYDALLCVQPRALREANEPREADDGSSSMLHHTQMDRLWAYWQALHPDDGDDVFREPYLGKSRFDSPKGAVINIDSPLTPFFNPSKTFYTTRSVRDIRDFGYSYEGLESWRRDKDQMRREAARIINGYGAPKRQTRRHFARLRIHVADFGRPCMVYVYVKDRIVIRITAEAWPNPGSVWTGFSVDEFGVDQRDLANLTIGVQVSKFDGRDVPLEAIAQVSAEVEVVEVTPPLSVEELTRPRASHILPASVMLIRGQNGTAMAM
ncbi:hypothetical protein L249_8939 [Ophiocordyceps polyrhachis-furcata BCC 54312]|uniref:tyrosinase n=1 Tax=Ophiocordyceps polyrhachis-furcata BCC 54312 TaxID=1330021 RepID=A0A367L1Z1_9HYPO|nr:hypothetical protein L249_8939 [Ophiocordyceps polyrhachis-furcata BCC 54312]